MKISNTLKTGFIATFTVILAACSNSPKGDTATVSDAQAVDSATGTEVIIDTAHSKIGFTGYGVGKEHPGYFKISNGSLVMNEGKISGGQFTISTKSLTLDQQESMFQTKLRGHLLGVDFFDADKYPSATFEITGVEPYVEGKDTSVIKDANYTVSGNLTLKDVTKNVSFPAKIEMNGNKFSALASFNIDRNLWEMRYGNDKSLKDKFISEIVNISFNISGESKK